MKTKVYIDGQNFLYKAAEILIEAGSIESKNDLTRIDIRKLVENIFGEVDTIEYYGAKVKVYKDYGDEIKEKTVRFSDASRRIRGTLSQQKILFNESGKLKVRDSDICKNCHQKDYRMQEKGVDVGIAVDMVVDALQGNVERAVLVSSDTDLLPAVKIARGAGVKVVYVGFSNKTTKALIAESDETEIIRDQEVINAFDSVNPQRLSGL